MNRKTLCFLGLLCHSKLIYLSFGVKLTENRHVRDSLSRYNDNIRLVWKYRRRGRQIACILTGAGYTQKKS